MPVSHWGPADQRTPKPSRRSTREGFALLDFLDVTIETDAAVDYDEPGDCVSTAFGFQPSPGDQRWENGADLGE